MNVKNCVLCVAFMLISVSAFGQPPGGGPQVAGSEYGSVSQLLLGYVSTPSSVSAEITFEMAVPMTETEDYVFNCSYSGCVSDSCIISSLGPGDSDTWDVDTCCDYDGPGTYSLNAMLSNTPLINYDPTDFGNAWLAVDREMSLV